MKLDVVHIPCQPWCVPAATCAADDKGILNPKEWGKTNDMWKSSLRDWPEPTKASTGMPKWQNVNYKRWPMRRVPRFNRSGVEVTL